MDADIRLLRKYGIGLQKLPLLCRHLLEQQNAGSAARALTFSEELMKEQADRRGAELLGLKTFQSAARLPGEP